MFRQRVIGRWQSQGPNDAICQIRLRCLAVSLAQFLANDSEKHNDDRCKGSNEDMPDLWHRNLDLLNASGSEFIADSNDVSR